MSKKTKILYNVLLLQIAILSIKNIQCSALFRPSWDSVTNVIEDVKCYGNYGCFPIDGLWISGSRQFNEHPQSPQEVKPRFALYNTNSMDTLEFKDLHNPIDLPKININQQTTIYVISHGYLEFGSMPWMLEMGKTLLKQHHRNDAIVVLIDWGSGSHPPYTQAASNIRLVGVMTAHLINLIFKNNNLHNLNNVHLIGHSLGAHLMGYVGYHLQNEFGLKVMRISGLDPAAPLFTDTEPIVRLDTSDAEFVDVIHTDVNRFGGLGINQRIGHIDFYPNGGSNNPGCDRILTEYIRNENKTIVSNMQEYFGCNHVRSHQYFTESIKSKCPFMGITCDSYEDFKNDKCFGCQFKDNVCIPMGFHSHQRYKELQRANRVDLKKPLKPLYLMTGDQSPFCRVLYKITVKIAKHDGEIGKLSLRLHGRKTHTKTFINFSENEKNFESDNEYVALVPGEDIQNATYATAKWEHETTFNILSWRITSPRLFIEYIIIESLENPDLLIKLCSRNGEPLINESDFKHRYCNKYPKIV